MKTHLFRLLIAALAVTALVGSAAAGSVTYGPVSFGPATTNWSTSISLLKWDPSLFPGQVLTGVSFDLDGSVTGSAQFESLDGAPATVSMNLQATITLTDPDSNVLVTVIPVASTSDNVTAFDGVIDFGGTSGKSYLGLTGSASNTGSSGNLAMFTGSGSILLPVSASGSSNASGAGNLATLFGTTAGASASVTYYYTAVPEPSTMMLGGLGIVALVVARYRRRIA